MRENDEANIEDCLYAINHIEEYTKNILSYDELLGDSKTYDAVLMNFVVIAEACNRISTELQKEFSEINWNGVRRFRNYIAHDYFGVDIEVVWQSLTKELPKLKIELQKVLDNG
ncbi:MAG: DUF86 domain-containing protein [Arachidicoccus sp.]|nr:DUF86 domain-containing protein [Arachidicoccus sp.]